MVSALASRPNHYEVLGLRPTASDEEIADAFARQMRLPHRVAELTQIGVAFDTLRSRTKRRSYDEALGLHPEPKPATEASAMSFRISAHLAALASPGPIKSPPASSSLQRPNPNQNRRSIPTARADTKPRSQSAEAAEEQWPSKGGASAVEQERVGAPTETAERTQGAFEEMFLLRSVPADERPLLAHRSALALGGLVLVVVLIGAWAGAHAQDSDRPNQELSLSTAAPHRKVELKAGPPSGTIDVQRSSDTSAVRELATRTGPNSTRMRSSKAGFAKSSRPAVAIASSEPPVELIDQADPDAIAPSSAVTNLPLPKAVIARTIERIGYSCGEVASSTPAEASGIYKVTCTSGQSYQATPVRGRYHFRRL